MSALAEKLIHEYQTDSSSKPPAPEVSLAKNVKKQK
jgi:hypothetical protein